MATKLLFVGSWIGAKKINETRSLKRNEGGRFAAIFILLVTVRGPLMSDRLHLCSWQMLLVPAGGSDHSIVKMQEGYEFC